MVRGFNDWPGLSRRTIQGWITKWPDANIGLGTRAAGLVVLDADHPDEVDRLLSIAGDTPLRTATPSGGQHLYYLDPEAAFRGVIRPGGRLFDIKGADRGDQVVLPGSRSRSGRELYTLVGDPDCHLPSAFSQLFKEVPPLTAEAYRRLTRTSRTHVQVPQLAEAALTPEARIGNKIVEGTRNRTLFKWACRNAHQVARRFGPAIGLRHLAERAYALNEASCEPPLPRQEVDRLARSAWANTLSGVNIERRRRQSPTTEVMIDLRGHSRATVLLASLSAGPSEVRLSVSAAVKSQLVAGWMRHDYQTALDTLLERGAMSVLELPRKGRGSRASYRLIRFLDVPHLQALVGLTQGNADSAVLFQTLFETWGEGVVPISARGMTTTFNRPFSSWSEARLRRARALLQEVGLLERLPDVWLTRTRLDVARFRLRSPFVLRSPENVGDSTTIDTPPLYKEVVIAHRS